MKTYLASGNMFSCASPSFSSSSSDESVSSSSIFALQSGSFILLTKSSSELFPIDPSSLSQLASSKIPIYLHLFHFRPRCYSGLQKTWKTPLVAGTQLPTIAYD